MGAAGGHQRRTEMGMAVAAGTAVPGVTRVALAAVQTQPRRGRRTETEIAAQAAMALMAAGLLSTGADRPAGRKASRSGPAVSDAALARVADVVGVPVAALRDAWDTNQSSGYRPPRPERGRAAAPSPQDQRPGNRERYGVKNPAPGRRICSDCKDEKDVSEYLVKNAKTGNRMPWCRSCGRLRGRRNYVSAAEAGIVTLARAHLAAGSPFIGQACPDCGLGLEAGQEVEGCDVTVRHVACPQKAAGGAVAPPESQTGAIARRSPPAAAKTPIAAAEILAPVIGPGPVSGGDARVMDPGTSPAVAGPSPTAPGRPRPAGRRPAPSTGAARQSGFVPTGLPVRDPGEDPEAWQDRRRRAAW